MSLNNTFSEKDTHYFTLDLHEGAILAEPLKFKQYDHKSRVLGVELIVHNTLLDLENSRVDIWVYKPDGKLVVNEVLKENIDIENSIILVPLTRQMLTTLPKVECEIVVTSAENRVLSFPIFEIEIEDSNMDTSQPVSTSEFDLFFASLVRMEQWIRDFTTKYNWIEESFNAKLEAIEEQKLRIIDEFEILSADLVQNDATRFEELKTMTIGEFTTWFTEAKKSFAYAGREIEKRFNELWEKCNNLNTQMEAIVKEADEHRAAMEQIKIRFQELQEDAEKKYEEIVKLYNDGMEKLEQLEAAFKEEQEARATAFATEQSARATAFEQQQTERTNAFKQEQTSRATAFATEQANRQTSYKAEKEARETSYKEAEATRDTSFTNAESLRQTAFEEMEVARNNGETIRRTNENQRIINETQRETNETQRMANETQREEDFQAMQDQFKTFITYKIVQ